VKLNLRNIMHRHATGTKRARACLTLVPVIMILIMVTRPIYAPLIDVFEPEDEVAGSNRAAVVQRDADARPAVAGLGRGKGAGARRMLLGVPPADHHPTSLGGVSSVKGGWGNSAEDAGRRFGER
jgi:hypothetical protein